MPVTMRRVNGDLTVVLMEELPVATRAVRGPDWAITGGPPA
jgi:hypothetical protein